MNFFKKLIIVLSIVFLGTSVFADTHSPKEKIITSNSEDVPLNNPFSSSSGSSEVIKNFQLDLNYFNALCQSFITVFVEILLSISVVLTLFYLEPISSIISGILIGISSITYVILTKGYIKRLGDKRNSIENSNAKIISEAINGIKEIKI